MLVYQRVVSSPFMISPPPPEQSQHFLDILPSNRAGNVPMCQYCHVHQQKAQVRKKKHIQMLHVGNIYLHLPLNVAIFNLM